MTRGFFCVFEGIDGSGKSGALAYVQDHLAADGIDIVATLEPGGTDEGLALRRLVLTDSPLRWASIGELLLMNAARAQLAGKVIQPALAAGKVVLCDRFVGSTLAHQGACHGIAAEQIRALHKIAAGDLWPDLTVLLDVEAEQALARSPRPPYRQRQRRRPVRSSGSRIPPSRPAVVPQSSGVRAAGQACRDRWQPAAAARKGCGT
jgi:dTMP kinase